jgi:hypothetical protein
MPGVMERLLLKGKLRNFHICLWVTADAKYAGMHLMGRSGKRKYERLPLRLDLSCRKVSSTEEGLHSGRTVNVSVGGLYFKTARCCFNPGDVLTVELSVPPTTGMLESGGRICTVARVLRTDSTLGSDSGMDTESRNCGVALEFCQSPKFRM